MILFRFTIFLSAALLFQIQLLIAGYLLPWFGGSAAVWMASMLFFQLLMVAGYAYAHLLTCVFSARGRQVAVHLVVLGLASALLVGQASAWGCPVLPTTSLRPADDALVILKILGILLLTVGLPFFVLSTTSALLQAWWNGIWPERSPYPLYAWSNAGSVLGLLCYPFLVTPLIGLRVQAMAWALGFWGFAGLCLAAAWAFLRRGRIDQEPQSVDTPAETTQPPTRLKRALWILLPAAGSLLMMGTTNVLTQEIAVMPMLWVLPLALYLISYVLAFGGRWYSRDHIYWFLAAIGGICGLLYVVLQPISKSSGEEIVGVYLFAMFVGCVHCHGELVLLRPAPHRLTAFYLSLSVGGALGGLFVAVGAPLLFKTVAEFPIGFGLAAGLVGVAMWTDPVSVMRGRNRRLWWVVVAVAVLLLGVGLNYRNLVREQDVLVRRRNFYGTLFAWRTAAVERNSGEEVSVHVVSHGETIHGLQIQDPRFRYQPTSYYSKESGVGLLMDVFPSDAHRVGLIGLGIGGMAAYGRTGDIYRFYEIDQDMIDLATGTEGGFTYLADSAAEIQIVQGDARLLLERESADGGNGFDMIILDAFSGDAVPVHLLTREAFELYRLHLKPGGALAVHASSRYFDLVPIVFRQADAVGLGGLVYRYRSGHNETEKSSTWIILSNDVQLLNMLARRRKPNLQSPHYPMVPVWTDDYSNLLQLMQVRGRYPFYRVYADRSGRGPELVPPAE